MRVCFVVHRDPRRPPNPVMAEAASLLERTGVRVTTLCPEDGVVRLDELRVEADVYVIKPATQLAVTMAAALEARGARALNRWLPTVRARDKALAAAVLAQADIPAPRSWLADTPGRLAPLLADGPLILKPQTGAYGVGISVAETPEEIPAMDVRAGASFAQTYLADARVDLKIFVIGHRAFGVRKSFARSSFLDEGEPTGLNAEIESLALRCGAAFGLELYGIDVAETPAGPRVIDVNALPGYRGVPGAAACLADCIRASAAG